MMKVLILIPVVLFSGLIILFGKISEKGKEHYMATLILRTVVMWFLCLFLYFFGRL